MTTIELLQAQIEITIATSPLKNSPELAQRNQIAIMQAILELLERPVKIGKYYHFPPDPPILPK